eukprot:Unigene1576_Nuclearia_a/m.4892 Unigene1576_Nuclearia_a/g.4892  ORF Unigene1576_Nuclearia_a/g.4892 Unigene1576_Nuclearia_a/m.4892 type:complete len:601 (-) Unigene1576_Nuclearia_a:89-1891(-)
MSYTRKSIFAALPLTSRGQPTHLSGDPKGKNFLYTNGRSVIIRELENPHVADQYTEHVANVTCARYAPSGFYIASGDAAGNVRIWDTTQAEHLLKTEVKVISGEIKDLAWDSESKRIIAVGQGQEYFGRAFMFDSGSSVGEISGHSKAINTVDIKATRPYRAATGSDDLCVNFFEGPPFKYKQSNKDHERFVNCIRYSPNGNNFVSVGADSKIILFNGATGEKVAELKGSAPHTGSIYSCYWSPDSASLLTCSADRTVKVWDVAAGTATTTFTFGTAVDDQQVGCLWQGNHLVSLSLSGDLNYLDKSNPAKPTRVVRGHTKPIMSLAVKDNTLCTGDVSGRVCAWSADNGVATPIAGTGHTNQATALAFQGDTLVSVGLDDSVRFTPLEGKTFGADAFKSDSQPRSVASHANGVSVVVAIGAIVVLRNGKKVSSLAPAKQPYSVAISADGTEVAVGFDNDLLIVYTLNGDTLTEKGKLTETIRGPIHALAYSPDGQYLAVGDAHKQVTVVDAKTLAVKIDGWVFHAARLTSVAWSPSGTRVASGSLDTHIYVWSTDSPSKRIQIKFAHVGQVNGVAFLNENTLVSVGQDGCVKTWDVKHH